MVKRKKASKDDDKVYREKLDRYRKEVEIEKAENEIKFTNLQEKISRLETSLDTLNAKNHELRHIISTKTKENKDLFEQQEYEMRVKDQRIKDMEKERKKGSIDFEKMKNRHEKEKQQLLQDFEMERQQFHTRINKFQETLDELHTFKKQKNKIIKENTVLKEQIQKTEKYTSESIEAAKEKYRASIREKSDELRNEFEKKQDELRALTDKHIGVKTLNTMKRNEYLKRELETQQIESKKMMETNKILTERNRELQQQNTIIEAQNHQLLEKSTKQQKTIRSLTEKLEALNVMYGSSSTMAQNGGGNMPPSSFAGAASLNDHDTAVLKERVQEKNSFIEDLKQDRATAEARISQLSEENEELKKIIETKHELQDEISKFLISTMNDIKQKLGPWKNIDNMYHKKEHADDWKPTSIIPASLDRLTVRERESVIRYLLSKLHEYDVSLKRQAREPTETSGTVLPPIHHQTNFHERFKEFRKQEIQRF
mmetsp:Transcript_5160/g.19349  ORF Transcript_5160/g.19349 Transcript_5160/m.19349 type:complete len:485 (-) Transcript_5160:118-1572(-)